MSKRHSRRRQERRMMLGAFGAVLLAGLILVFVVLLLAGRDKEKEPAVQEETAQNVQEEIQSPEDSEAEPGEEDPQAAMEPEQEGVEVQVSTVKEIASETDDLTIGIDVSEFQGNIDWDQVSASGIDFVMVRLGYRTAGTGVIREDACAKYNLQEAGARNIHLGAYFFSTAMTEEEAREEARWVCNFLEGYPVTYPVAYNCEGFQNTSSRQYGMTVEERSHLAQVFLDEVEAGGYTGMFYAAKNELMDNTLWTTDVLESKYRIWVAQYAAYVTERPDYTGKYAMWQHTNQGSVPGINAPVDLDMAYFGYSETASAQKEGAAEHVEADPEVGVDFEEVNEQVTSKDVTNLRTSMDQSSDSNVAAKLRNGETAVRTGKGNNGWSRVEYDGKTLYAVSSYLTTDLGYQTPVKEPDDGFKQTFTKVNENVTAKDVTNLRSRPSMEDSEVIAQLHNGEVIVRTGASDYGWSRVEYNGQTLYCIGSYLTVVE